MKDLLTSERASRLLFAFYKRHQKSLSGFEIEATRLNPEFDVETGKMCERIAKDPDASFETEARQTRALLLTRILEVMFTMITQPNRWEVLKTLGPVDDKAAIAALLVRVLARMELPAELRGRASSDIPKGWVN